jgi:hypothetical protein
MRIVGLVVSVLVLAVAGSAHGATQGCDAATATPLVQEPETNPRAVSAVYCGAFLGEGSDAMVVVISSQGGCNSIMGWRVFARANGVWQAVGGFNPTGDLSVNGTTIVERRNVHRARDWFGCNGYTGGTQERSWSWDGAALTAGAWTQTVPARPKGEVARLPRGSGISFYVARLPIICAMLDDDDFVLAHCEWRRLPVLSTVRMSASGRLRTCKVSPRNGCNIGDPGEGDITRTLRAGESVIVGRFRCRAQRRSMRCVVISSGRGFVIGRDGPRAVR